MSNMVLVGWRPALLKLSDAFANAVAERRRSILVSLVAPDYAVLPRTMQSRSVDVQGSACAESLGLVGAKVPAECKLARLARFPSLLSPF